MVQNAKLFKEETSDSPMQYLQKYRIKMAQNLLRDSKSEISKIALKCGFKDANYFSRAI
ncbi:MAG TPA: hypothetical protein DCY35_12100 [Prolixibacteraceae bacterium]|nr:hypothetical protein [Prolixibacteraceae bacterium]